MLSAIIPALYSHSRTAGTSYLLEVTYKYSISANLEDLGTEMSDN